MRADKGLTLLRTRVLNKLMKQHCHQSPKLLVILLFQESQEASAIILSNLSTSVALGEAKCFGKYCKSTVPDWCTSATPENVLCCPESPNKAMAVTLKRGHT